MTIQDKIFVVFIIFSCLSCLVYGIISIVKADDSDKIREGVLTILVGITPGAALIVALLLFFGFMILLVEGPTKLIVIIKQKLNGRTT
jgi:hypothetical protein